VPSYRREYNNTAKTVRFNIEIAADLAAAITGAAKANNVAAGDIVNDCVRQQFETALRHRHHAPHFRSVAPRYSTDILTAAFASNMLDELLSGTSQRSFTGSDQDTKTANSDREDTGPRVDLFIHGHVHNSADYHVGRTRVVCNPHGYGRENAAFNPSLIIEVGS
jgi:hypothetical protein